MSENDLLSLRSHPVCHVLQPSIRHVVATDILVEIVEWLGPVEFLDWKEQVIRQALPPEYHAQQSRQRRRLIVGIETHRTTQVEGLLEVSVPIELRKDSCCCVQVRVPDRFRLARLPVIVFLGHFATGSLPILGMLLI